MRCAARHAVRGCMQRPWVGVGNWKEETVRAGAAPSLGADWERGTAAAMAGITRIGFETGVALLPVQLSRKHTRHFGA